MINVFYSEGRDKDIDYKHLKRRDLNNHVFVDLYLNKIKFGLDEISSVEIETRSGCNGDCGFCPMNHKIDHRLHESMDFKTFSKIIKELENIDYRGYISYFSNNEPLLDNRIIQFIRYGRKHLPCATHSLFTNGILLNNQLFIELTNVLDRLCIDNYSDDLKLHNHIRDIIEKNPNVKCDVSVFVCKKSNILDTRAGNAPNRKDTNKYVSTCILPFTQLVFKPNGSMTLCCQDAFGQSAFGNINETFSLEEIYCNINHMKILKSLKNNGRYSSLLCRHCDLFGFTNYNMSMYFEKRLLEVSVDYLSDLWKDGTYSCFVVCEEGGYNDAFVEVLSRNIFPIRIASYGTIENAFYIFATYNDAFFDEIDPDSNKLGVNYIIMDSLYYLIKKQNG